MKIVTVISGSGAFLLIFAGFTKAAEFVSAFVALWAMIDFIVGPDKKADLHSDLRRDVTLLAAKMETMLHTAEAYKEFAAERLLIEQREPPCKRLVDLQARNDECRARAFPPDHIVPLSGSQRWLGYFFTFGMSRQEKWSAARC